MKVNLKILFDSLLPLLEIDSFSSDHVTALCLRSRSKEQQMLQSTWAYALFFLPFLRWLVIRINSVVSRKIQQVMHTYLPPRQAHFLHESVDRRHTDSFSHCIFYPLLILSTDTLGYCQIYFWWITCRVLFSGQKREDLYFILRLSLFTKLNASLPSICLTLPGHTGLSTKRIFLKICRNILTNVCPTWSIVAASMTLKSLTVNIWLASTNKFAPSLYHQA